MATLKSIRKRISSVKSTQKITKAMKMVAAAKLRRASQAVVNARPYANYLHQIITSLSSSQDHHPLFQEASQPTKACFLIYTSNRGLCGGFNSSLLRKVETFLKSLSHHYKQIDIQVIGKKGRDFYQNKKRSLKEVLLIDSLTFEEAKKLALPMIDGFLQGHYDEYYLVYNRFKSALSQEVTIERLLPIKTYGSTSSPCPTSEHSNPTSGHPEPVEGGKNRQTEKRIDYLFEPSKKEVLETIIPKYVATQIYRAHLESTASELGARMTAMGSATTNAGEMISKLTLQYNRLRQAAITKELMDIVNGAEAIK